MTEPDPHRLVAAGYDRIANRYAQESARSRGPSSYYRRFLEEAVARLPPGGMVLDLGCGAGLVAADVARRCRVVGVDISWSQLRLARERVIEGAFVLADMARLEFRPASFDAVAAFWSLIHVRRDLHAQLYRRIHDWLRPDGVLFGTFGSGDNPEERAQDFLGAPMYWSHYDAETNRHLLREAGFTIERAEEIEDAGEPSLWVVATAFAPTSLG